MLIIYRSHVKNGIAGRTNQSGVLSENTSRKAYSEWLLPLRTLTMGMQAENEKDGDELAESNLCALATAQLVSHLGVSIGPGRAGNPHGHGPG